MSEVKLAVEVADYSAESELAEQRFTVFAVAWFGNFLLGHTQLFLAGVHAEDVQSARVADAAQPVVIEAERQTEEVYFVASSPQLLKKSALLGFEQPYQSSLWLLNVLLFRLKLQVWFHRC